MANLKDIVATLAILSAGTLTLTGCKKTEGETTTPDEVTADEGATAGEVDNDADADDDDGEASCGGEDGEASCSGEGDGEGEGEGEAA